MPSLIPGYEYDIFISYRHKDNLPSHGYSRQAINDGWVTEFVSNLRKELEATFKEEVSIYFDENPTDGLHETHDVEDSLAGKVKSLVFIPVISRTYCDPNSFAWRKEFLAFRDFASHDSYGLKVKVAKGNVSSRILPVRIHDLENEDINLFEKEVGNVLRPVDFIFKSTGVNRPLRAHEDEPRENQNHTFYRDQINKLAIIIKETITGIKHFESSAKTPLIDVRNSIPVNNSATKPSRSKVTLVVLPVLLLVAALYFLLQQFSNSPTRTDILPKSIAVLPFENISNDPEQEYFSDGITEQIITELSRLKDLKVIARTSVMKYKKTTKSVGEIGSDLNVTHVLEGSVRKSGDKIRVTAQLISVNDESNVWVEDYNENLSDIFLVQDEVSAKIAGSLKNELTPEEISSLKMERPLNAEAYEHYLKGEYIHSNHFFSTKLLNDFARSEDELKKAIELDPFYATAYAGLADLYDTHAWFQVDSRPEYLRLRDSLAQKAFRLTPTSAYVLLIMSYTFQNNNLEHPQDKPDSTFKYMNIAYRLAPNDANLCEQLAVFLDRHGLSYQALPLLEHSIELNPLAASGFNILGRVNFRLGDLRKGETYLKKSTDLDPNLIIGLSNLARLKIATKDLTTANQLIEKIRSINSEAENLKLLDAMMLAEKGEKDKALSIYRNGVIYAMLGMNDEAIDFLTLHPIPYLELINHPALKILKGNPKFQKVVDIAKLKYEENLARYSFVMIQ